MAYYQLPNGQIVPESQVQQSPETGQWYFLSNPTSPEGGWVAVGDGVPVPVDSATPAKRSLAVQLGFSPLDIQRYAAMGIPEEQVGSRLQSYLQKYGQSPSDVNWWGQNARDRVMGLTVDPRQEAAEQYGLGQAIMRSQQDEPSIFGLPASLVQGAGTFASLVGGLNALAGLPSFFSSTGVPSVDGIDNANFDWIPESIEAPAPTLSIPGVGDVYGSASSILRNLPNLLPSGFGNVVKTLGGIGGTTGQGASGQSSAGSRGISGADSALQTMRNAIATDEGKYPSPIKPKLQEQVIFTGQPVQVPALFSGFDPKFLAQMEQRGYAMSGQVEPTEYVPGPEGKYFARHAKRGFAVNGPGTGQSDDIPTMLADGEYVIDSDTVAALGDGSSKAGAAVLDKFREQIRKHKRSAPIDDIPPKAKSPLAYLKEAQKGKKNG